MVKLVCNTEMICPITKLFRSLGLLNPTNVSCITIPYNGWFKHSQICGCISYKTMKPAECVPGQILSIPVKICAYRDLKTCTMVAREMEALYKKEFGQDIEIEVEFVSPDYFYEVGYCCD